MTVTALRSRLEAILGRPEEPLSLDRPLELLNREPLILITGARGSLGAAALETLRDAGAHVIGLDIDEYDVRQPAPIHPSATVLLHLAAWKDAPKGEVDPGEVVRTNIHGTENVLSSFRDAKVVLASTCKAADPETVYGASKLIAERMVLAQGGRVARFFNVVESSGNVFETWDALPAGEPLPVTPCQRHFISLREAVSLLLWAAVSAPGRYGFDPGPPRRMIDVARDAYPDCDVSDVPRRRGDRLAEPLIALCERCELTRTPGLFRIRNPHDGAPA